jgi:hypothetical protein
MQVRLGNTVPPWFVLSFETVPYPDDTTAVVSCANIWRANTGECVTVQENNHTITNNNRRLYKITDRELYIIVTYFAQFPFNDSYREIHNVLAVSYDRIRTTVYISHKYPSELLFYRVIQSCNTILKEAVGEITWSKKSK